MCKIEEENGASSHGGKVVKRKAQLAASFKLVDVEMRSVVMRNNSNYRSVCHVPAAVSIKSSCYLLEDLHRHPRPDSTCTYRTFSKTLKECFTTIPNTTAHKGVTPDDIGEAY